MGSFEPDGHNPFIEHDDLLQWPLRRPGTRSSGSESEPITHTALVANMHSPRHGWGITPAVRLHRSLLSDLSLIGRN